MGTWTCIDNECKMTTSQRNPCWHPDGGGLAGLTDVSHLGFSFTYVMACPLHEKAPQNCKDCKYWGGSSE